MNAVLYCILKGKNEQFQSSNTNIKRNISRIERKSKLKIMACTNFFRGKIYGAV